MFKDLDPNGHLTTLGKVKEDFVDLFFPQTVFLVIGMLMWRILYVFTHARMKRMITLSDFMSINNFNLGRT